MKTIKIRFSTLFTILFLCLFVLPTFGAGRRKSTPVPVHETVVTSVSPTSIVITADKVPKTYTVTQFTEVTVNGQKSTLADVKPGMLVSVTLSDPTHLSRISATTK
jgi:hypothetical protein